MKKSPLQFLWVIALAWLPVACLGQIMRGPIYKPLDPNAPKVRVDGRVRGTDDALLTLTVLAPEHVGLTTKAQPCLYWYQSQASQTRFELTISEARKPQPLYETEIDSILTDGIQRLSLAEKNITLRPGVEYRWTVAMVLDAKNRSKDVVASGVIKRVAASESLKDRLLNAAETDLPFIYADEGIWYDSLEALSNLIDKQPTEKLFHEHRAVYFMQVGLNEAARHELRLAGQTATPAK